MWYYEGIYRNQITYKSMYVEELQIDYVIFNPYPCEYLQE